MKRMILIFVLIAFSGCAKKTAEEKLIEETTNNIKLGLDDPESFQFVSINVDTIKRWVDNSQIETLNQLLLKTNNPVKIKVINDKLNKYHQYADDEMEHKVVFRAKNKFGALVIQEIQVVSDTAFNFRRINTDKKPG